MSVSGRESDLQRLAKPFPPQMVARKEGADYVNHGVVQQRLLGTVGPFTMRVDQVIRGPIDEKITGSGDRERTWPARSDAVVGVVLTCVFTIDDRTVEVAEVGTPEGFYMAAHDGDRLKKAVSDALKRCAMRIGVGLDLWSKGAYFLPVMLGRDEQGRHIDPDTGEVVDTAVAEASAAVKLDHAAADPDEVVDIPDASDPPTDTALPPAQEAPVAVSAPEQPPRDAAAARSGVRQPADAPQRAAAQLDDLRTEAGVTKGALLRQAREVASALGVPVPTAMSGITDPRLNAELVAWLETKGAA